MCCQAFQELWDQAKAEGSDMEGMYAFNYKFAIDHKKPIELFGRYPTRNEVLGRVSTAEELEYLKTADGWGQKKETKPAEPPKNDGGEKFE